MKDLPFVSVIIANLNSRQYLARCLLSLMDIDYPKQKLEIILVDDASSDDSVDFIKHKFPSVKIIRNKKSLGPAESRNIGIKIAKGNLIAFLDNDVEVEANWLKPLVDTIISNGNIAICSPKVLFLHNKKQINSAGGAVNMYGDGWGRGVFEEDRYQYDNKKNIFFGCSVAMLTKKEIIERIGCFDKDYFYLYEDLDYAWRANLIGFKVAYVPESVVYHKFGATMKRDSSVVRFFTERNRILTLLKNYETMTLIRVLPKFLKQRINRVIYNIKGIKKMNFQGYLSFLAAWLWNALHIYETLKKRASIQSMRQISDKGIFDLMGDYKYKIFIEKQPRRENRHKD